jgi:hypothetical protein
MYTSESRRASTDGLPTVAFPSKRFVVRRKLVAARWFQPVHGLVPSLGRGDQVQESLAFVGSQRGNERKEVVCGKSPAHHLYSNANQPSVPVSDALQLAASKTRRRGLL